MDNSCTTDNPKFRSRWKTKNTFDLVFTQGKVSIRLQVFWDAYFKIASGKASFR